MLGSAGGCYCHGSDVGGCGGNDGDTSCGSCESDDDGVGCCGDSEDDGDDTGGGGVQPLTRVCLLVLNNANINELGRYRGICGWDANYR